MTTTFGRNRMSTESVHFPTFVAETETENEIRSSYSRSAELERHDVIKRKLKGVVLSFETLSDDRKLSCHRHSSLISSLRWPVGVDCTTSRHFGSVFCSFARCVRITIAPFCYTVDSRRFVPFRRPNRTFFMTFCSKQLALLHVTFAWRSQSVWNGTMKRGTEYDLNVGIDVKKTLKLEKKRRNVTWKKRL